MAIQNRRGAYVDLNPAKAVPGELLVVQSGDPNATDGKAVYITFGTGDIKRLATDSDVATMVADVADDLLTEMSGAITTFTETTVPNAIASIGDKGDEVIASIPGDYTTLQGDVATAYSTSKTYAVGDYVMYSGQLYRCKTAITTAESWTASKWTAVAISDDVTELKSAFNATTGDILFNGSKAYSGSGNENWFTYLATAGTKIAIKLSKNTTEIFEISIHVPGGYPVLATISDNDWHIVELPSAIIENSRLILSYKGTTAVTIDCVIVDVTVNNVVTYAAETPALRNEVDSINSILALSEEAYGNNGDIETTYQSTFLDYYVCNCKKVISGGKITQLYIKSYSAGATKLYVGTIDQLYLFVPRAEYDINVQAGEHSIDVSDLNIYINSGEQLLFKFIGQTPFKKVTGTPEGDNSFYYGNGMQLQVYGAQYAAVFGFGYTVTSTVDYKQNAAINENTNNINTLQDNVSFLQSNFNVVSDRQGNKYKMIVQNGAIALLAMEFNHILCVGNSYTTHPTTADTETDYRNSIWWGHRAMASSSLDVAWTTLLQDVLRQKNANAVVTPVFGRRYETNPTTYNLSNSNTFTYWNGSAWTSLKDNIASFNDVDAIVFFLGANYSGDDWYTLYKTMIDQFYTWFPNVSVFCCSCSYSAMDAKDMAIQTAAAEKNATYISMVGTGSRSKIGAYVKGDDSTLHQINNSAVANHYGDYGQYLILDRICNGIGYENIAVLLDISLSTISGVTLSVASKKSIEGAVVSVFAEVASGTTLTALTAIDANSNTITVTDHGVTDYGRVFTFIMPSTSVTVTAS